MTHFILCSGKARCVDRETEFFDGHGWKKISDYRQGDKVLQYNKDGTASLVTPNEYISMNCDSLWEFENTRTSQCLTDEHNCYYITSKGNLHNKTMREIMECHQKTRNGFQGRFLTSFLFGGKGINLSDDEIKLMCAVICDSAFIRDTSKCYLNLKKERKQNELRAILTRLNIQWDERTYESMPGYIRFVFEAPRREKEFSEYWYDCSHRQLEVICENICKWDGHTRAGKPRSFNTTSIKTADFLQFAYASIGKRVSIIEDVREGKNTCYQLNISDNTLVSLFNRKTNGSDVLFKKIIPVDGKCYCFSVPSGLLILRRNRKIFITGNSGKDTSAEIIKDNLESKGYKVLITHYADLLKFICKNFFGWNGEKDDAGRTLLQQVGTNCIREQDPDYWVDFVANLVRMFPNKWDFVIVGDVRFPNELSRIADAGFPATHVRIIRPDFESQLTEEQKHHPSETALNNIEPDFVIKNTTISALKSQLQIFCDAIVSEKEQAETV